MKHKTEQQRAGNIARYSYISDISRIEKIRENKHSEFQKGYAIMLTNHENYKILPNRDDVKYIDFSLKDKQIIEKNSKLSFSDGSKKPKKKFPTIEIKSEYNMKWDVYSDKNDNNEDETWYILINEIVSDVGA